MLFGGNMLLSGADVSGGGGFSPDDIAGIQVWFDFNDSSTLTLDGSEIDRIDSKVGTNFAVPTVVNLREPTLVTDGSVSWARFSEDALKSDAPFSPRTIFFTTNNYSNGVNITGSTDNGFAPVLGEDATTGSEYFFIRTNATDYTISVDGNIVGRTGTVYTDLGLSGTGSNINLGLSNAQKADKRIWCVTSNTAFGGLQFIGAFVGGNAAYLANGDIGDILGYDSVLSTSDINQVGNFLAAKHGITWSDF